MSNLLYAARPLLLDFLGAIVFAALLAAGVSVTVAAAFGVATVVAQVGVQLVRRKPVAPLQWLSLVLVISSGAATLITHDPRFLMAKPSIIYAVVGVVMLKRGWMLRYVPPIAAGHVGDVMTVFGYVWAGLMFATGAANAVVAVGWPQWWPAFIAVVPLASKAVLFAVQYPCVRAVAKRRIIAAREAEALAAA
jgi:intracellular septation protein A